MSNIIQQEIEKSGLKKKHIAEIIGITPKTLTNYINYKNIIQVKNFLHLCTILKINIADIAEEITKE